MKYNSYKVNFRKWDYGMETSPFFTHIISILKQVQVSLLYSFWNSWGSAWLGFELSLQIWRHYVITSTVGAYQYLLMSCINYKDCDYCRRAIRRCPLLNEEDIWFSLIILMSQYVNPNDRIGKNEMSTMDYLGKSAPLSFPYSIASETIRTWS